VNALSLRGWTIEGWMSEPQLAWLSEQAGRMASVIEIGSWKGLSTSVLLAACDGPVHAVDHFLGAGGDDPLAKAEDIYGIFMRNVGDAPNLVLHRMSSEAAAPLLPEVDMVFIDADHGYDWIRRDIELWLPHARRLICGHDFTPEWPGVVKAVSEAFRDYSVSNGIWWVVL
jgi:hypothetical protein